MHHPLLLGHRGARSVRSVTENTLPSFDLALQHGCDGFEFDVRSTADGEAVICHDPAWHPPHSRSVEIARATRNALLALPSLSEVLERYRQQAFLDIELKVSGIEALLAPALQASEPGPGLVVSSFLPEALVAVHRTNSALPLGLICENLQQLERWPDLPVAFVIPHHRLLAAELLDSLHAAQKKVMVWTVNDAQAMQKFAAMGVDGIISDVTQLLVRTLGSPPPLANA